MIHERDVYIYERKVHTYVKKAKVIHIQAYT